MMYADDYVEAPPPVQKPMPQWVKDVCNGIEPGDIYGGETPLHHGKDNPRVRVNTGQSPVNIRAGNNGESRLIWLFWWKGFETER
jgi:hypothetical protein